MRVLIVDDHEPVRRGIRSLLACREDWSICGEAADGLQAVEMARQLRPDVILMDMSMPRMDGAEATRILRRELPTAHVVVVSQNDPAVLRSQVAQIGACAYVSKKDLSRDLVPTIEACVAGATVPQPDPLAWLSGDGEMARLMRSTDWSETALGAPQSWSPALRMMVKFLLANRFPQLLWWGPEFSCLYNDAYIPILGGKHPWALGQPVSKVWHEIWSVLKPLIETPYNGGPATWMEDIPLEINRRGFVEETHFTIAYSPVPDETMPSGIGGVLATVHEITQKVIAERRVQVLRDLGARSVEPKSPTEACTIAVETLARHSKDVPFVFLYLFNADRTSAHLAAGTRTDVACPHVIRLAPAGTEESWPIAKLLETEEIQLVQEVRDKFGITVQGPWSDPPSTAAIVPIRSNISHQLAGFLMVGISSRLRFDESYRDFLELLSTQIATTIANARVYEEERKRADALAEIDRAKTLFFSNVSHEFRTPLTLMLAPLEDILGDAKELAPEYRDRLQMAHRNSLRLLKLVNTLLDFSRIEAGRIQAVYQPTDLSTLTAELAGMFQSATERAGLRLTIHCSPVSQPIYVDQEMWEKIVFNLLSNAFKFTFEGEIEVSVQAAEGAMQFSVRDTGIGIAEREIPHLFQRFYRVKGARGRTFEGSGIGLSLVDELVRLHGGTVSVQSQPNVGSTFTVSLPFGKEHLPAERIEAPRTLESTALRGDAYVQEALRWLPGSEFVSGELPAAISATSIDEFRLREPSSQSSSRILVADDNADMREYVQRLLAGQYELQLAADGESALKLAREHRPDLILADVMMPRLDGFALLQAVRSDETLKSVPVILLSARAGEEARIEGFQSGADDYLVKPFSARELLARVRAHLAMTRFRQDAAALERKLRLDAELLAAIVASSDDAMVSKDLDGVITSWNKGAERIFGYTAQEAVGRHITLIIPADRHDEETDILSRLRRGEPIDHFHTVRVRKDGSSVDVSLSISPIRDSSGRIVGAAKVARDISTQIRADKAVRESEENYRRLAETLELEVRARTLELETRNAEILRQADLVRDFSQRHMQAQDEERRRIARELHDSAGQTLTVLGIGLAQLVQKAARRAPELANDAQMIQESVQQLHREIRTTSYLLHPPLLDENGLASALQWYVQGLVERSSLDIRLDISEDFGRLPRDLELVVFRVVQESLTNIHRHSGSKTAKIRVAREPDAVSVEVQDEGGGMAPEKLAEIHSGRSGVGIRGMRERIRQFEGLMNIESSGSGTRISVAIPIPASPASTEADTAKSLRAAR